MDSEQAEQELRQKSDHELLVMLVAELQSMRRLFEAGYTYSIQMDESRSGAWGATYRGSGLVRIPKVKEPTGNFRVMLTSAGKNKNKDALIKAILEINRSYSPEQAKGCAGPGAYILSNVDADTAQAAKSKLESVGATAEIRQ